LKKRKLDHSKRGGCQKKTRGGRGQHRGFEKERKWTGEPNWKKKDGLYLKGTGRGATFRGEQKNRR